MTGYEMNEFKTAPKLKLGGMLPFGQGNVGEKLSENELIEFKASVENNILPITDTTTAQCIDGRATESRSDNSSRLDIDNEVLSQGPGGLSLHLANALVASDAIVLRDAGSFSEAYQTTRELIEYLGYKPSKHEGCLAAAKVEDTYKNALNSDQIYSILSSVIDLDENDKIILDELYSRQKDLLREDFFDSWNPEEIKKYVKENHPHNHSVLVSDQSPNHGHYENALLIIKEPGYGFAKNKFINETNKQAFAYTPAIFEEIVDKIAVNSDEARRIKLALWVNLINVANVIIKPDHLAVFI